MTERRSWDEVRELMVHLMDQRGPVIKRMRDVLHHYEGEWIIPTPDVSKENSMPMLTPALVGDAVDFLARRAASQMPRTVCPALDPNKDTGRRSREYATIRNKAISATYGDSRWKLARRKFYRHLAAYHCGAITVAPNFERQMPELQVRDPLSAFPEPQASVDFRPPLYVGFVTRRSGSWLRKRFPQLREESGGPISRDQQQEEWELCEWIDENVVMYGLLGPVYTTGAHISWQYSQNQIAPSMQIGDVFENKLGRPHAVVPENISLDRISSRIGSMLGNIELQAKMMALNIQAMDRAVFPDMYAIGDANGNPQVVGGHWKDGREGEINILKDVKQIGATNTAPPPQIQMAIDQLERNARVSMGLVPQAGGETYGALRTGRGIDALASIALDPTIQEMHEVTEEWMSEVNEIILDTYKVHWGGKAYSMYSRWPGDKGLVEFTPSKHFETTLNIVSYEIPGADVNQLTQILGSLRGTGSISQRTMRDKHPWIGDGEAEGRLVDEEDLESAVKQAILTGLAQGTMDPVFATWVRDEMQKGADILRAVELATARLKQQQAQAAPPPQEDQLAAPETMPGLAAGPTAMQQQPPVPDQGRAPVRPGVGAMKEFMQSMAS